MAETATSPNNVRVAFKGKPMAKTKQAGELASPAKPDKDWEAEDALRTMQRAEEHASDAGMMKRVGTHVKKQTESLAAVQAKLEARGLISPKAAEKMAKKRAAAEAK